MALRPGAAYDESRVRDLLGDRESLSLIEILRLDIPAEDRVWLLLQPGVLPADVRTDATARIVTRAVTSHALHCGNTAVEEWARGWLDGTNRSQAAYAANAAYAAYADAAADAADAAWAAARAAAWAADAAHAAACAAADAAADAADAAWAAARAAAWAARAAARDAACAAAWGDAERQMQVADIVAAISAAEENER